ncbi:MAG: endonuclease III [Bacteroidetes bacterium]|nr:endonuclease III [Bacteroidota bacterium]MBU2583744.1 endonuclease III [Bacteroidota bacterium]
MAEHFGKPKRKLDSKPLDILIATILSQNTNDRNSHKAYLSLRSKYPNWSDMEKATVNQIAKTIRSAGLSQQKAKTIKQLLLTLKTKKPKFSLDYLYEFSNEQIISELTSISGIGVKTASCVLLFGMQRNVCPVDTHVFRTLNRIGVVNKRTAEKTFYALNEILPKLIAHQFHTNLIMLGRTICKPQKPICTECPLLDLCTYKDKNPTSPLAFKARTVNDFLLLDVV